MKSKGIVGVIVGIIVGLIMIIAVAIPVTQSVIDSANLSGTTATIVGFIPLFLGLAGLVLVTTLLATRR
jgi:hypothetical protein